MEVLTWPAKFSYAYLQDVLILQKYAKFKVQGN